MMSDWVQTSRRMGVPLDATQVALFEQYAILLLTWNEKLNLTAVRRRDQIYDRHFLDSLSCIQAMGDLNGRSLIDVGTGAGFPGIPLKIVFPELQLTLVESIQKKARFLETAVSELQLKNVRVLAERAEQLARQPTYRAQYDWAVARAVAELRVLLEYLLPFCRINGTVLSQKGPQAEVELAAAQSAIEQLGGGEAQLHPVNIAGQNATRYLITVCKKSPTPDRFPRRVGVPSKRPL